MSHKLQILLILSLTFCAASAKQYTVDSPDKKLTVTIDVGQNVTWSVNADGRQVLSQSALAMTLADRKLATGNPKVKSSATKAVSQAIETPFYKRSYVADEYNQLTLRFNNYAIEFRAYNDAAAYRFVTDLKGKQTVMSELAEFKFPADYKAYVPYVNDNRGGERYSYSFESYYDEQNLSQMFPDSLAITPLLVVEDDLKVAVSDFGVEDYPGMFLKGDGDGGLVAEFAPVPVEGHLGGYNFLNYIPTKRADYIATDVDGKRSYPWRAVIVSRNDTELANTDIAMRLSIPNRVNDTSWIRPGKVAWDWWNNLHLTGVDFKAGRNNDTYNYYVDFATQNGIEYIIVDEGWSDENTILVTRDNLDIPALVKYANDKGVGVILWASWKNVHNDLDQAMKLYGDMGVAGFKVDFFDADDQNMMRDMFRFAEAAAKNHMLLDYHGMKANGMQVTYPNIVNFEGVKGLENYRWSSVENNPSKYAVTAPFIRTIVGPMDYTPGAMINLNTNEHRANNDNPASEGTRANQLAMYVVYDAPLQMLADSPSRYMDNQHCTDIIAQVPTVFDETLILDGMVGEYIVTAKRAGNKWYIGAMTNREPRDLVLDLSFVNAPGKLSYVQDGVNVDIDATDHKHGSMKVDSNTRLNIKLAPTGGWMGIIETE